MFGRNKNKPGSSNLAANLRDERLKFEVIVNTIEDGVMLIDNQGDIQLFNPGAAKITGWASAEACGLNTKSVIKLVDSKGLAYEDNVNPLLQVFQQGLAIRENNAQLLTKSDKKIPLSLHVTPLIGENAMVNAAVVVFRDVAEEKAEEQRRADFISTASHEMRTPVAAIEGYLALALNPKVANVDAKARDYLEKAHISTQHLGQLFQDLLTSAKAEDGRLSSRPVVVEMSTYLEQTANDLKFSAEKKGLFMEFVNGSSNTIDARTSSISSRVVQPMYYTFVDPDRLREVVTNLFDNAVKYTDEGKISIGLTGDGDVVQFYVRDTGPGIPAEDVPHLFQKFYRVDNSATRTIGGTGLGLFICRKIVELYNGRIWLESDLGKGSTFFINFPRLTPQQAADKQAAEAGSTELAPISSLASS
ncbi:PAS domain S-box protein [Candidatus Saccharibacteria bacterium]|nr:PAS domain S-box protein [Candidatus Saccharibacteria bacterium]